MCIVGAEFLFVEKAVLKSEIVEQVGESGLLASSKPVMRNREVKPEDWHPWSMITVGAVIILYSFTLPRRVGS